MITSKWTPFFLLLAAAALVITPMVGLIALLVAGIFLIVAFIFAIGRDTKHKTKNRTRVVLIVVAVLLTVALFGFMRYQLPLLAAPGYKLHNVTDPGWLNGRIKTIQAITEQIPCTYTLLGWQEDENLYYQASCDEESQIWHYTVAADQLEKVDVLPTDLYAVPVPLSIIEDKLLANVYPRDLATVSRRTFVAGEPLSSANGRYIALISRHVYGPQDVLLLTPEIAIR